MLQNSIVIISKMDTGNSNPPILKETFKPLTRSVAWSKPIDGQGDPFFQGVKKTRHTVF